MKRIFWLTFVIFASWKLFGGNELVTLGPGIKINEAPLQKNLKRSESFAFKDYQIIPLAEFNITAKVLARKDYSLGRESDLSPVDFVLGWQSMSDEAILEQIDIKQSGRWYHWRVQSFPIPRKEIETQSANMHLIPADDYIENLLDDVKQGQLISIEGYLIRAEADNNWAWQSSLSRNDTGAHACEVIFVKSVNILSVVNH